MSGVTPAPVRVRVTPHEPLAPERCGACGREAPLTATVSYYPDAYSSCGTKPIVTYEVCEGCGRAAIRMGIPLGYMRMTDNSATIETSQQSRAGASHDHEEL